MGEDTILCIEKKKSETKIRDMYDVLYLQERNPHMIDCNIYMLDETIQYQYDMKHLECVADIEGKTKLEQLQVLIAIARLQPVYETYDFLLEPQNIFYTKDIQVKIKERDVKTEETVTFVAQYKALIGSVLIKELSFLDILNGGSYFLEKNEILPMALKSTDVEEIREGLLSMHESEYERMSNMAYLPKKIKSIKTACLSITSLLTICLFVFTMYQQYIVIEEKNRMLQAYTFFIDNRFVEMIDYLADEDIVSLDSGARYMLAISYIKSSNLQGEAKQNALSQVRLKGNEEYVLYWSYLGRKDFDSVYEITSRCKDERLLYYAYSVELESLTTNTSLSANDKSKRKGELESMLEQYIKDIE